MNQSDKVKTSSLSYEETVKFEIIEDALLENVSGSGIGKESEICMCWQFCTIPPEQ